MSSPVEYGQRPKGYRLPDESRLGAVRLQVASLERSVQWYQTELGVEIRGQARAARVVKTPFHPSRVKKG